MRGAGAAPVRHVTEEGPEGLTARFAQAPDEHDGANPFTLRVAFSEAIEAGARSLGSTKICGVTFAAVDGWTQVFG